MVQKSSMLAMKICSGGMVCLSAVCLRQVDVLSRPKHSALPGLYVARYGPQPRRHIKRIDSQCGPEGQFSGPMLFRVAGSAQGNGVAIAWFHPRTATGPCTHMCSL